MKRVTFNNGLWIEFDNNKLIPKITDTHWKASNLLGRFILNSHDRLKIGHFLNIGKTQDDKNWISSDFINEIIELP